MQPGVSSLDLSVGFQRSRTGRVISLTVAGFLLVVLCGCLGAILGQFVTMGRNAQLSAVLALASGALAALADALGWAHCPGAREAAGWLRAMAADPRTMLL
ncbi:hypothetical protein ACN28G_06310 [Micromonospora sp. WMMA1923]|uniref:hypothetical protein n=1 Tax=Micromonospora sp. WMMA1923 TaxID=3404125 RepID=UPI003B961765